jgi:transcriptional regulator with XRE-family HTH domain
MNTGRSTLDIAWRLRATLAALKMTPAQFGRRCGFEAPKVSNWLNATATPRLDAAHTICDNLPVTLDWIYRGDASKLPGDLQEGLAEVGRDIPILGTKPEKDERLPARRGRRPKTDVQSV